MTLTHTRVGGSRAPTKIHRHTALRRRDGARPREERRAQRLVHRRAKIRAEALDLLVVVREERRERSQPCTVTWVSMGVWCLRMDLIVVVII